MMVAMLSDPLVDHDIETNRRDSPEKKLAQALDLMEAGIRLKRAALAHVRKDATQQELDVLMTRWLCSDG
jgi:hypothetical protein